MEDPPAELGGARPLAPGMYGAAFNHSAAYGYYADAQRASSDFQRFELLYKVMEYFFAGEGDALDAAVSAHAAPHNPAFTQAAVKQLRELRDRSIHPRARKGHVNPQNIANAREVHDRLPAMETLASILLANPTF